MKKITKKYNDKTSKDLIKEVETLREEISKLQLSFKSNPPKDSNSIVKKKKQLAVMLTLLTQKK